MINGQCVGNSCLVRLQDFAPNFRVLVVLGHRMKKFSLYHIVRPERAKFIS